MNKNKYNLCDTVYFIDYLSKDKPNDFRQGTIISIKADQNIPIYDIKWSLSGVTYYNARNENEISTTVEDLIQRVKDNAKRDYESKCVEYDLLYKRYQQKLFT